MSTDSIRVVCRLRPLNKIQIANKGEECVTHTSKDIHIKVDQNQYDFAFDRIFGPATAQVEVYKEVALPVIKAVFGGFNGTIFAYGQTGGGKTWTMEGPNHHDPEFKGLIPRTIEGIFHAIAETDENIEFVIKCSYVEIYNQKLFDLLDPSKSRLEIKEDKHKGVFIQNCTEICVASSEQMLKTMDNGSQNRKVAFTGMNERSSRSHSLFVVHIHQKNIKKDSTKESKLYFVDLAGSEKVGKTGVVGAQLEQAKNINKSLSSLGNVINALTSDKKEHIPYRDSKLTRILQESLGGNSKTTLIINCSMCTYNDKETLSTLRFGYRAKSIKNKPKVNEEKSAKELLIMLEAANKTINELKLQLGGKLPVRMEETQQSSEREEAANMVIEQLRDKLNKAQEQEAQKEKELKEMELRVKNILMELSQTRESYSNLNETSSRLFKSMRVSLTRLNKYMSRVYIDLQYWINNLILDGSQENAAIKGNLDRTFNSIMEFTSFYEKQIKQFFAAENEEEPIVSQETLGEQIERHGQRKKIRLIYSQPTLAERGGEVKDQLQMSCYQQKIESQNDTKELCSSDKMSQEQSFNSQLQTLLQSLQTKESHRILLEEMSYNLKMVRKENDELQTKNERLIIENKTIAQSLQQKYEDQLMDLQQRVEEYRKIIKAKDLEITGYIREGERWRDEVSKQKVASQRFKKVIENNTDMKMMYNLEEKVRVLASQRQNIFNELYQLRDKLDQADINIREKQEHIESLKAVMKELTVQPEPVLNEKQIQKKYNRELYGTQAPNVVVTVKGGHKQDGLSAVKAAIKQEGIVGIKGLEGKLESSPVGGVGVKKQSSLRKKVNNVRQQVNNVREQKQEEKGSSFPFIKGFFS